MSDRDIETMLRRLRELADDIDEWAKMPDAFGVTGAVDGHYVATRIRELLSRPIR